MKLYTDSCGWCVYWIPSGCAFNEHNQYEKGTCCRYPKNIKKISNDWCGEFKTCESGSNRHGPPSTVPSYRDKYRRYDDA